MAKTDKVEKSVLVNTPEVELKTEPVAPTVDLNPIVDALRAEKDVLDAKIIELSSTIDTLRMTVTSLQDVIESNKKTIKSFKIEDNDLVVGSIVGYNGYKWTLVDIDLAWEIGQKVEKSFVEEDAPVIVLKKI